MDRSKIPLICDYHGDKPYTDAGLRSMPWERAANIGIALRSDRIALDVDVKNAKSGDKHLAKLERKYGALPHTLQQKTRSGGVHMIFRLDLALVTAGFRSRVVLPDGRVADIDIVHSGNRYLVIYDIDAFLDHEGDFAEMPLAWYPALVKRHAPRRDGFQTSLGTGVKALIDEVRHAKEGCRNDTLNRCVFKASASGLVDDEVLDKFQEAAQECGLLPYEIAATIASATCSAPAPRTEVEEWRQIALHHPDIQTPRTRVNMLRVIDVVASVALLANAGQPFGLSARYLAERTGLCKDTSARYLNLLESCDLLWILPWCDHSKARRYQLKTPRIAQKSDSLPLFPAGIENSQDHELNSEGSDGGESRVGGGHVDDATVRIASHRAFRGIMKTRSLPPSSAPLLALLERTPQTEKGLTEQTGFHRNTITKNIQLLNSEGLVVVSGTTIRLSGPNPANLLDQWVLENQQQDPTELQRKQHQQERHKYLTERLPAARNESRFNQHCRLFEKYGLRIKKNVCGPGKSPIRGGTYERVEHRATVHANRNERCSLTPGARESRFGQARVPFDATRDPIATHVAIPHISSPFGSSKTRQMTRDTRCPDMSKSSATGTPKSPAVQPHASKGTGCLPGDARPPRLCGRACVIQRR